MQKIESARIRLGFLPSDSFDQRTLKEIRERRARAKERHRRRGKGLNLAVAGPEDLAERIRFKLERARKHILAGRAMREETDYARKHL